MKKTITAILAIALMTIPTSAMAHIESWAEYDKRLEKQIAELDKDYIIIDLQYAAAGPNPNGIVTGFLGVQYSALALLQKR